MSDNTVRTKLNYCPRCAGKCDAATSLEGEPWTPKPRDMSVCIFCGIIVQFTDTLGLKVASQQTLDFYAETEQKNYDLLKRAQQIVLVMQAAKRRNQG